MGRGGVEIQKQSARAYSGGAEVVKMGRANGENILSHLRRSETLQKQRSRLRPTSTAMASTHKEAEITALKLTCQWRLVFVKTLFPYHIPLSGDYLSLVAALSAPSLLLMIRGTSRLFL